MKTTRKKIRKLIKESLGMDKYTHIIQGYIFGSFEDLTSAAVALDTTGIIRISKNTRFSGFSKGIDFKIIDQDFFDTLRNEFIKKGAKTRLFQGPFGNTAYKGKMSIVQEDIMGTGSTSYVLMMCQDSGLKPEAKELEGKGILIVTKLRK